jgi:hypothetical protein
MSRPFPNRSASVTSPRRATAPAGMARGGPAPTRRSNKNENDLNGLDYLVPIPGLEDDDDEPSIVYSPKLWIEPKEI